MVSKPERREGRMKEYNKEEEVKTVGDLRKVLEDTPDDWILIINYVERGGEGTAINVESVNSFWHGALTFEMDESQVEECHAIIASFVRELNDGKPILERVK